MLKLLKAAFGITACIKAVPAPPGLPVYMVSNREFFRVSIDENTFLLISLDGKDRFGAVALEKQLMRYMEAENINAAYAFPTLTKVQRDALVSRGIPFISPPDQLYLPFLGMMLTNRFRREKKIDVDHFTPATQSLFLYLLYEARRDPVLKKDAAIALGLTRTSITRASEQLKALHLITEEVMGKEVRMIACAEGETYYEMAGDYLIDPVDKVITVKAYEHIKQYYAGETALGVRSMLNPPAIPVIAIAKKKAGSYALTEVDEKWETTEKVLRVELWKYDPGLFAEKGIVDPVSMAVSLRNCSDERVQGELKEFMEGYAW